MRRLTYLLTIVVIIAVPGLLHAAMESYCSAPPYITRSIAPNIMILMDNSNDMYNPAYTGTYSTSTTYTGYFKPGACYKYSTNKFVEEQNTGSVPSTCTTANCYTSYTSSDTCPSTAPFRGNLLNWATMSKYDVLQKVIIGGNATSKQGNAHTLISASNDWGTDKAGAGADSDVYSSCEFLVSGGTVTVKDVTGSSCTLLNATPVPIAFWQDPVKNLFAWLSNSFDTIYSSFFNGARGLFASLSHAWGKIELTAKAWASHTLAIIPVSGTAWTATVGQQFTVNLSCSGSGSACPNGTYGWTFTGLPAWMSVTKSTSGQRIDITATLSGTPTASGTHTITAVLSLTGGHTNSPTYTYTLTVSAGALTITTVSLPAGGVDTAYSQTLQALGGASPYTWDISAGSLPPGLSLNVSTGEISGTPTTVGSSSFTARVTDSIGSTATKALSITVAAASSLRSTTYNVKVELVEEDMTDLNGNNIWDTGETYTDFNGNGSWDGKQGVFQKFWDENNPRARWGLTKFGTGGTVEIDSCMPASPASSFYTRIQNAQPTDESPLARGLYGIINYFGFSSTYFSEYVANQYSGCSNSNPLDNTACRKNFVLVISSGSNVGPAAGYNFTGTNSECTVDYSNSAEPLVKNACYGYKKDLRDTATADITHPGKQNLYTYIVDTGSETTNDNTLKDAAQAGHGKYYPASSTSDMEAQLTLALTDILAQAASGTAVSVLTTSSRGIGSMVQAYFLPTKLEGTREVWWTGYTQNIWIDPKDNLREDTTNDYKLKLDSLNDSTADKVIKLYFDSAANETKVATFTTDANGENGTLASCSAPESAIKAFDDVNYLWEGGKKLALTRPNARKLFTSTKVLKTSGTASITTTTQDFSSSTGSCGSSNPLTAVNCFTVANIAGSTSNCSSLTGNTQTMCNALDHDTSGDADKAYAANASNIVSYALGECLETGISGDTPCGTTANGTYRDRRLPVSGGDSNGNVWKLGDIISSTPKVLANTPVNTYHIDYGDSTYYNYVTSNSYKQRSSIAFVGANDGVLHAFRVGYLKDTGLDAGVNALFKNFYSSADTENNRLGEEVWGYIPFNAFPYLRYLASTGYCHIYFNDLSVRLVDASIGGSSALPTDTRAQADWKTILIGGMRFGGGCAGGTPDKPATVTNVGYSAYYAIDITNPEDPVPLWEFSDDDMGYASTFPSVIRTGETNKNGYWYVIFGSGSKQMPKANTDIYRGTTSPLADPGYIYILNLKTGALEKKIALDHNAIVGDILAIDKEKDYHAEKVYFGTTYKDNTDGIWKGKLVNIAIPNQNLSDSWTPAITYHFSGNYPFTASPDAARDTDGNVWVFAGSGKYYSDVDDSDASAQIFLGMKDSYSGKTTTNMDDRTNSDTTGTVTGTALVCGYDSDTTSAQYGTFHLLTYVTSISGAATVTTPTVGWYLLFSGGERIITRPLAIGGLVDFLTYKPNASDPCSYGGSSYLYAVGYTTGVAPANVAIMAPDAVTSGGTVKKGILLGPGAPPTGEAIIIPPPKEGQETLKKKIQIATGVIVEAENQPVTSVISKVVHWLKK